MNFYIRSGANLPILKVIVIDDGRSDFQSIIGDLKNSEVYFSMYDYNTNLPKIENVLCQLEEFVTTNGNVEYYITYQFRKKDTAKLGKFKGQFTIKNEDGVSILPIDEGLSIYVLDSITSVDTCCPILVTPSNTRTPQPTETPTPSVTTTNTPSVTQTNTPTQTQTQTPTNTQTPTTTQTPTNTETPTNTPTQTPTVTQTPTITQTPTNTTTPTNTETSTNTPTVTQTSTNTNTPTVTNTPTLTQTPTNTNSPTVTQSPTRTMTQTPTRTPTSTSVSLITPTPTQTTTTTPTVTPTGEAISGFFRTIWSLNNGGDPYTVNLPTTEDGDYDMVIEWGDGDIESVTGTGSIVVPHTYPNITAGESYECIIKGKIIGWSFGTSSNVDLTTASAFKKVIEWGQLNLGNTGYYFSNEFLRPDFKTTIDSFSGSVTTSNYTGMFSGITLGGSLFSVNNIGNWNMSAASNFSYFFADNNTFNDNLTWNTANVTNMKGMFKNAYQFDNNNSNSIGSWVTSGVTGMSQMFVGCSGFNRDISSWNTSKVVDFSYMFSGAAGFNQNIGLWNTSKATDMSYMFAYASDFNFDLNSWNTTGVTTMSHMFDNATSFNGDVAFKGWNVSSVKDMSYMFKNASSFNKSLSEWQRTTPDVSRMNKVSGFTGMFQGAVSFNQDISNWETTATGAKMDYMFQDARAFNQPLNSWDTSNVIRMDYMFAGADVFDQEIANWNIQKVGDGSDSEGFIGFMSGKTNADYSTSNYDALWNGWINSVVLNDRIIDFGTINYTTAGETNRQTFIDTYRWTINDGGRV